MKAATSFDVAREAGVSQPTVSRALRGLPGVSPETRERIVNAARRLRYVPSERGRVLSTSRTARIAVLSEELDNPFYPELVEPIRRALAEQGWRTVVVGDSERETVNHELLLDGSYDGVLLTTARRDSPLPGQLREAGMPHVLVNRATDEGGSNTCRVDNKGGVRAVAGLLLGLGHRRFGLLDGPVTTSTGHERADTVVRALADHVDPAESVVDRLPEFSHEAGLAAARTMLDTPRNERPTALICANDVVAFGALSAARDLGLAVPHDLSVVGFDDIAMSSWPMIDLTTVHVDLGLLATTSVDILLRDVRQPGRRRRETVTIPTSLALRGSHGAAPR